MAAGVVVAWALVVWTLRERRRFAALVAGELLAGSLVFYATVNDRFYGGITPRSAGTAVLPDPPFGYVERLPRLVGLWLDREVGLLRWAPLIGLAFFAAWLLYRSRRDQLARVAPARREAEATAGLLLAVIGAQLAIVALVTAGPLRGTAFPGVSLVAVLPAAGRAVRVGAAPRAPAWSAALLALVTLGGTAWLLWLDRSVEARGWLAVDSDAPWGPLVVVFPDFTRTVLVAGGGVRVDRRGRRRARVAGAPRGG